MGDPTKPHVEGHPLFCVCAECSSVIAASHKAADEACGREWSCNFGACRMTKELWGIFGRFDRIKKLEGDLARIRKLNAALRTPEEITTKEPR